MGSKKWEKSFKEGSLVRVRVSGFLVGCSKMHVNASKNSREWLDPHCHESEFQKETTSIKGFDCCEFLN
ncbi:hypothetical protein HanRHA438_Chr05g0235951 [Helianthus annuus]|nr:hypothetical protein HanRHA438_Chr05g0235951 [Helianthus annuus]